jgi:hypothetical protein
LLEISSDLHARNNFTDLAVKIAALRLALKFLFGMANDGIRIPRTVVPKLAGPVNLPVSS